MRIIFKIVISYSAKLQEELDTCVVINHKEMLE